MSTTDDYIQKYLRRLMWFAVALLVAIGAVNLVRSHLLGEANRYQPASPLAPDEWAQSYGYTADDLHPFAFNPDGNGRSVFQAALAGSPVGLFFDSGNGHGLTVLQRIAERHRWPVADQVESYDAGGNLIATRDVVVIPDVELIGLELHEQRALSVSKDSFGSFGWSLLGAGRLTLDYEHQMAGFSKAGPAVNWPPTPTSTQGLWHYLTPTGAMEGTVIIPVTVGGREVLAHVDTGASVSVIDPELASELSLRKNLLGRTNLEGLVIGPFTVDLPSVSVHSSRGVGRGLDRPVLMTLGADFLSRFLVTFDFGNQLFILVR